MALIEVVKYNGTPDVFAWKFPSEELGTWTQLIVNESQEAILFKGGQALDLFASGTHTLETANIPILNKIINLPFGGRSPFAAEVWYINKVNSLDVKWGTATPIQLQDPKYKIFAPVRSFGQFGIQIEDSRKFLIKLVGTLPTFKKDDVIKYFRGLYLTRVKDAISSYLIMKQVSILEINAYLDELSEFLCQKMTPTLAEYGIKLLNFYVNDINVPEDDEAIKKLKEALAKRAEMDIVGYNYIQERSFDTLEGAATNTSSGQAGLMGTGMGLGMGVGIGGVMGSQFGGIAQSINPTSEKKSCPKCKADIVKENRYCSVCGFDSQAQAEAKTDEKIISCNKCGAKFQSATKFCTECGNTLTKSCPKCGTSIESERTRFCPECGTSLAKKCPTCNVDISGNPKFCPECGGKL